MKPFNCILLTALSFVLVAMVSCKKNGLKDSKNLADLPADTGGIHRSFPLGTDGAPYGYYVYTPSETGPQYPLLIFLHGAGEKGNSSQKPETLDLVLRNGPPMLIKKEKWDPTYPMVVVSPQCHDERWFGTKIHKFITHIINNYDINTQRIYVTGLSLGGVGTFSYLTATADSCYAAAAVPICGWGNPGLADKMKHIPVWAFHGDADKTVPSSGSLNMIKAINEKKPPVKAKVTIYPGVGHDSWSKTYDGTGMGSESSNYDPFDMTVYDWMFQYERK